MFWPATPPGYPSATCPPCKLCGCLQRDRALRGGWLCGRAVLHQTVGQRQLVRCLCRQTNVPASEPKPLASNHISYGVCTGFPYLKVAAAACMQPDYLPESQEQVSLLYAGVPRVSLCSFRLPAVGRRRATSWRPPLALLKGGPSWARKPSPLFSPGPTSLRLCGFEVCCLSWHSNPAWLWLRTSRCFASEAWRLSRHSLHCCLHCTAAATASPPAPLLPLLTCCPCSIQGIGMSIYATALTSGNGTAQSAKLGSIIVLVGLAGQVRPLHRPALGGCSSLS